MPGDKKSKNQQTLVLQRKSPSGFSKKRKRVRQSEKIIKEGKVIRVDDEGVEDFDDYFTKSNLETDPSITSNKPAKLNRNTLEKNLPCKHYSTQFRGNSDDSHVVGSRANGSCISEATKPTFNVNDKNHSAFASSKNTVSKPTRVVLVKNEACIIKKHRRKRKNEDEVKRGKIIKSNNDGIEEFDDYFTKSSIIANSSELNAAFKRSKSPKKISESENRNEILIDEIYGQNASTHNGLPSQNYDKISDAFSNSDHTLNECTLEKNPSNKSEFQYKVSEGLNLTSKICKISKGKTEQHNPYSSKFNGVAGTSDRVNCSDPNDSVKCTSLSKDLSRKNVGSPCCVTVVNLTHTQSFVDQGEPCKLDFSPSKSKPTDTQLQCKQYQTLSPNSNKQYQTLSPKSNKQTVEESECDKNYVSENVNHNELVNVLKHCSYVRLEIENLSQQQISKLSTNSSKIASTTAIKSIQTAIEKSRDETKNTQLKSSSVGDVQAFESGLNCDKTPSVENRKIKNSKGGKHFLLKHNFARECRSSSVRRKHNSEESDSDDASESDGHIYIPSKPSTPKVKRVSTGDPEDLAIPSTSKWKPIIKKSKKRGENKAHTPEVKKKLSIVENSDKVTNLWNSPNFQPIVLLSKLQTQTSRINKYDSANFDQCQLVSNLKGTRKMKPKLSVSFKEPEFLSNKLGSGKNFLLLHTPTIHTPNVRRSRRKKIPRLNYGLNQKVIYKRQRSGGFSAVGVDLGCTPRMPRLAKDHRGKIIKKELGNSEKSLSVHHPSVIEDHLLPSSLPQVIDPLTHQEVTYELFSKRNSLTWFGPTSFQAKDQDPFVIAKPLQDSFGFLKLRGNCEKPFSQRQNDTITFIVTKGKILVEIHNFEMVMEKDDVFMVPKGNSYKLRNLRDDEATFIFITK